MALREEIVGLASISVIGAAWCRAFFSAHRRGLIAIDPVTDETMHCAVTVLA